MKKLFTAFIFLSFAVLLPAWHPKVLNNSNERSALSRSSNRFAFALIHAVLASDSSNRLVSPVGVYLSLSLLYNGANKATRDSIGQALQVADMDILQLNAQSKGLLQEFSLADKKARFSVANSVWLNRKKLRLLPAFGELGENYYYSAVQSLPFNGRATAEKINRWTIQNTNRQFPTMLQSANPNDLVYLANACSFSSSWQQPFDPSHTQQDFFYLPDGHKTALPFMQKLSVTRVYSDTSFTMVELPYGNGNAYGLFILLPNDLQQTVGEFVRTFREENLYDAMSRMNDQWVDLSLPRWEQKSDSMDMQPVLKQVGLGILSNQGGQSDLSNMCAKPGKSNWKDTWDLIMGKEDLAAIRQSIPLSGFYHRTCFGINEKGTLSETGAATDSSTALPNRRRCLTIRADHPFLYFVMAKQPQVVVLAGVMNDPTPAGPVTNPHGSSPSRTGGLHLLHGKGHHRS